MTQDIVDVSLFIIYSPRFDSDTSIAGFFLQTHTADQMIVRRKHTRYISVCHSLLAKVQSAFPAVLFHDFLRFSHIHLVLHHTFHSTTRVLHFHWFVHVPLTLHTFLNGS